MRLLIATGLYPPEIGGPATYTKLLEERLPKSGFEVFVLPFRVVRDKSFFIRHIAYALQLAHLARKADLIFAQDTVSTGFPVAIVSMLLRKKFVVRVPGDYAWEQGTQRFGVTDTLEDFQKKSYGIRVALLRVIQRFVVRRAHKIIAPSEYLATIISQWTEKKIDVIYNGVELVGEIPGVYREECTIVTVGRLVPWKGFDALIDIVGRTFIWKLVIIGDGPERAKLEARVKQANAGERIQLLGQLSHDAVRKWLARATVFVLNSRYEGLSHTLVEALAAGAPTIATAVGGNPEVVRDEVDGLLVPPESEAALERALALLMQDWELRAKLGKAAVERAKSFSIEKTVETTATLLKSCVS